MAEAELSTIARPYARAAFSFALDQPDGLNQWSRMLAFLTAAATDPRVQEALDNPRLTTEDETALLVQLLGDDLSDDGQNFVGVLAENGRLSLIPTLTAMYELLKANHEKTMEVDVVSAFEVSDKEMDDLAAALSRKLQRKIKLDTEVDKSLIGGVIIKTDTMVIDDSVRGRLTRLSHALD